MAKFVGSSLESLEAPMMPVALPALQTAKCVSLPPPKQPNRARRAREYLSSKEVGRLRQSARRLGRHGHRDDTLLLLMFRHGLRVGEIIRLRGEQVDLAEGVLHVRRLKRGVAGAHPLRSPELRALKRLRRESFVSPYLFVSELKTPLTARTVHHIVARAGEGAGFGFSIHPHMLRHSTGFYLASQGVDMRVIQAYLG